MRAQPLRKFLAGAMLCAAAAWLPSPVAADALPKLTLADAQQRALKAHPDIAASGFDVSAAEQAIRIARSIYAPQVSGNAVQAFAPPDTRLSAAGGINNPNVIQRTALGVDVGQYIADFGRTSNQIASLQYELKAQAARGTLTRDSVLLNVTQAYFEVLRARALLVVANQTLQTRATLLKQVTVLQRSGLRSLLDVSIAARDVSSAKQLVLVSQQQLADGYAALSEAMGLPDMRVYSLEDVTTLPVTPTAVSDYLDRAFAVNPELEAVEADAMAARTHAVAVSKETSPTISAYGYAGLTPIRDANEPIGRSYSAAGVLMNVPIVNGGELAAERRQAEDQAAAASEQAQAERNRIARDVREAYSGVEEAYGNIAVAAQLLKTAKQAYALTSARYRIGLNSIVDLSDAQLNETEAAISRENALYDYIEREAALEFVAGILAPNVPGSPTTGP